MFTSRILGGCVRFLEVFKLRVRHEFALDFNVIAVVRLEVSNAILAGVSKFVQSCIQARKSNELSFHSSNRPNIQQSRTLGLNQIGNFRSKLKHVSAHDLFRHLRLLIHPLCLFRNPAHIMWLTTSVCARRRHQPCLCLQSLHR